MEYFSLTTPGILAQEWLQLVHLLRAAMVAMKAALDRRRCASPYCHKAAHDKRSRFCLGCRSLQRSADLMRKKFRSKQTKSKQAKKTRARQEATARDVLAWCHKAGRPPRPNRKKPAGELTAEEAAERRLYYRWEKIRAKPCCAAALKLYRQITAATQEVQTASQETQAVRKVAGYHAVLAAARKWHEAHDGRLPRRHRQASNEETRLARQLENVRLRNKDPGVAAVLDELDQLAATTTPTKNRGGQAIARKLAGQQLLSAAGA